MKCITKLTNIKYILLILKYLIFNELKFVNKIQFQAYKTIIKGYNKQTSYSKQEQVIRKLCQSNFLHYVSWKLPQKLVCKEFQIPTPSFSYFLPSLFLSCCAILQISFGGKGPHLRKWPVAQPLHQRSPSWGFLGFSSAIRQMPGDLCTAPRIILLSTLSLATDVTDATLGASALWLGTRTGGGGTAAAPMDNRWSIT